MTTKTTMSNVMTIAAAAVFGCAAAVAVASTAAVSQVAPSLLTPAHAASTEVIRLEPVVVTISKSGFDAVRNEVEVARANAATKVTRG